MGFPNRIWRERRNPREADLKNTVAEPLRFQALMDRIGSRLVIVSRVMAPAVSKSAKPAAYLLARSVGGRHRALKP
jgi:hypothetical protein